MKWIVAASAALLLSAAPAAYAQDHHHHGSTGGGTGGGGQSSGSPHLDKHNTMPGGFSTMSHTTTHTNAAPNFSGMMSTHGSHGSPTTMMSTHGTHGHGSLTTTTGSPSSVYLNAQHGHQYNQMHGKFSTGHGHANFNFNRRNVTAQHHYRYHGGNFRWPHGYRYQRWTFGMMLPSIFWGQDYWIDDYYDYGLAPPPPGCVWVRYGDDAILIDRYTGEILEVVYDQFD